MKKVLFVLCALALVTSAAFARESTAKKRSSYNDGSQKTGIGFNSQIGGSSLFAAATSALSIRYWMSKGTAIEGIFGFSLGDVKNLVVGGKLLGAIKNEQNMVVYGFGLLGVQSGDVVSLTETETKTNVTVGGGLGAEFFLSGLPNLGLGAEIGLAYGSQSKVFTTFGDWVTSVGARYYF